MRSTFGLCSTIHFNFLSGLGTKMPDNSGIEIGLTKFVGMSIIFIWVMGIGKWGKSGGYIGFLLNPIKARGGHMAPLH